MKYLLLSFVVFFVSCQGESKNKNPSKATTISQSKTDYQASIEELKEEIKEARGKYPPQIQRELERKCKDMYTYSETKDKCYSLTNRTVTEMYEAYKLFKNTDYDKMDKGDFYKILYFEYPYDEVHNMNTRELKNFASWLEKNDLYSMEGSCGSYKNFTEATRANSLLVMNCLARKINELAKQN